MPQPLILKIAEIFPSIQGEGLRQGEPTIFVRLSGCNLNCSFCDTKYAWKQGKEYSINQILDEISRIKTEFPARWICLTGGEPLLQDISSLIQRLKKENFKIQVETNATNYQNLPVDWYTISPKPEKYFFQPEYKEKAKEVKIIVTKNLDFGIVKRLRKAFPDETPLILQPQSNRKWSLDLAYALLKKSLINNLENIRISVQLHKILGIP